MDNLSFVAREAVNNYIDQIMIPSGQINIMVKGTVRGDNYVTRASYFEN